MKHDYHIYNRVKDFRLKLGLTQEQLSILVYVTRLTIISIEKQQYEPSIGLSIKLSKVFECSIEDLFWIEEEKI